MSEQDGIQPSTKQRMSRKTSTANQQNGKQALALQRPANDDNEAWKEYWKADGQLWRIEPEIDEQRQKYLTERSFIKPDIEQDIYPFKNIKLSRADVEWLMATHENWRRSVIWSDESQQETKELDLRGADLREVNLNYLTMDGFNLSNAHLECADLSFAYFRGGMLGSAHLECAKLYETHLEEVFLNLAHLEGANLSSAHLQGANLTSAKLQGVDLSFAHLEEASLWLADLKGANLSSAHLQGANLTSAKLQGVKLNNAFFDSATKLNGIIIGDKTFGIVSLADIHWSGVNVAVVDWSAISELGNEQYAREEEHIYFKRKSISGFAYPENKNRTLNEYRTAVRAYRQLAVVLRDQGLNEDAARFAYRAQCLQRKVYRFQRDTQFVQYFFSLLLDLLTGYGYKPWRSFVAYLIVIGVFAATYYHLGSHLAWNEAIVISMTAFHGRGFFPDQFHPGDPQALVAAIEAFVGLLIEVTFIATLTQRLFGK